MSKTDSIDKTSSYLLNTVPAKKTEMPAHLQARLRGVKCPKCKSGILYAPAVTVPLPMYLTDALLLIEEVIVFCDCAMGQGRKAYAERTVTQIGAATFDNGYQGEVIASHVLQDVRKEIAPMPTIRFEQPPAESVTERTEATQAHSAPVAARLPPRVPKRTSAPAQNVYTDADALPDTFPD